MATDVLPLVHVPPEVVFAREVVAPLQTVAVPVIVPDKGSPLTVTTFVVFAVPQLFVTV